MVASRISFPRRCVCLVTDRTLLARGRSLAEFVEASVDGGAQMVQLREKDLATSDLVQLAQEMRLASKGALLVVNGDAMAAKQIDADGVHLPESNRMSIAEVRTLVGKRVLIGRSVHGVEEAVKAQNEGADYLIVGTVFETSSKPGKMLQGLSLLSELERNVNIPFLGIGGIDSSNVGRVMACGASGVAVVSAILGAEDPRQVVKELVNAMLGSTSIGNR